MDWLENLEDGDEIAMPDMVVRVPIFKSATPPTGGVRRLRKAKAPPSGATGRRGLPIAAWT